MPTPLFYFFAAALLLSALVVVCHRNPVGSAMSLVCCFISLAALFIGLNAYFLGIIQILVYAGAVMVLFLFIIMLLDIDREELLFSEQSKKKSLLGNALPSLLVAGALAALIISVCLSYEGGHITSPTLALKEAAEQRASDASAYPVTSANSTLSSERLPDVKLIGELIFTRYNFHLQMIAVLLLVSSIGVVTLSKKYPQARLKNTQLSQESSESKEPLSKNS